jgi:hypothetical protein
MKGSRKFIPNRWATNPKPQIAAAINSIKLDRIKNSKTSENDAVIVAAKRLHNSAFYS